MENNITSTSTVFGIPVFPTLYVIFLVTAAIFFRNFKKSVSARNPKEQSCQVSFQLVKPFQRRRCLKKANDNR